MIIDEKHLTLGRNVTPDSPHLTATKLTFATCTFSHSNSGWRTCYNRSLSPVDDDQSWAE